MKNTNSVVLFFCLVGYAMGIFVPNTVFAGCIGTYYAKEFANGEEGVVTSYSLWTFSKFGSVVSVSSSEPTVPFGGAQGNWKRIGANKIESKTFDFSGPTPNPSYPNVARIEAVFKFKEDCSGTVLGQSKINVISCPVAEGPLCTSGFPVVTDKPIELIRVSGR